MTLRSKVLETIRRYNLIQKHDGVVVGFSGGPDSACLIHVLSTLRSEFDLMLYAVHINHMLRGSEAEEDADYVRQFCEKLNIPIHIKAHPIEEISKQRGISLEEAGREVRYQEFETFARSSGATKIAVAHNRNDQTETVLMRIIRGTGLDGLKAMEHQRGRIIRPLLDIDRKDIENYCEEYGLNPRIDSSNLQCIYTRNRIRLELIPYINEIFETDITENIHKMSLLLRDDYEYIEQSIANLYNGCVLKEESGEVYLDIGRLRQCHAAAKKRIIRKAVRRVKGDLRGLESVHIEDVVEMLSKGRTGAVLHLPGDVRVEKSYDVLRIFTQKENSFTNLEFDKRIELPGTTIINEAGFTIAASVETDLSDISRFLKIEDHSSVQFFDYQKLNSGINIRNRRIGDLFKPLKSSGTKKLKEYFIDTKVPRAARDKVPLVVKNNEVVWIIGHKISDKFKVTENTKSILKLEYIKNTTQ